jgi:choline dehydrogenase-like flavoprotein
MEVEVIIVGTGFGASVAVTKLLEKKPNATIHMLERGLWWFTSERPLPDYIKNQTDPKKQPVQYWPRPNHSRGIVDLLSIVRTNNAFIEHTRQFLGDIGTFFSGQKRPQPLYRYSLFKDIDIVTASGVGGGSLIYANVSIEPRFDSATQSYPVMANWPLKLTRDDYQSATPQKQGAIDWMTKKRGKAQHIVTRFPLPNELGLDPKNLAQDLVAHHYINLFLDDLPPASSTVTCNLARCSSTGRVPLQQAVHRITVGQVYPPDM